MDPTRFALRDDDTSAFTTPEVLEEAYGHLWDRHPVSLAVIPFAVETRNWGDPLRFEQDEDPVPLGRNRELVRYLRDQIAGGRVSILLHGYCHRYRPGSRPGEWIPEFVHVEDPFRLIGDGRRYLETLLDVRIRTFVPPSNALSPAAYTAVRRHGLNLTQLPPLRVALATASPRHWSTLTRRLGARVSDRIGDRIGSGPDGGSGGGIGGGDIGSGIVSGIGGRESRGVLAFPTHRELAAIPITPRTTTRMVRRALERRTGGVVCLATHHWELHRPLSPDAREDAPGADERVSVSDVLADALAWLDAHRAIGVSVDDLFESAYAASRSVA